MHILTRFTAAVSLLSSSYCFAITADLTDGVTGALSGSQMFNGTRAAQIAVVTPAAFDLTGITIRELSVDNGVSGNLGARIYDVQTGSLLSAREIGISPGEHQSITVPILARLYPGHEYRVGFFSNVEFGVSANGIDVDPAGLAMTPYFERAGLLQVEGIFQADTDAYPAAQYHSLPFISLELVEAVPEPSTWMLLGAGFSGLIWLRSRRLIFT